MAITDGILAYWNLNDDGSGGVSLLDATGNGNTLTNNGSVALGAGFIGNGSASFDTYNYLNLGNSLPFTIGDFSVSLWVNPFDTVNYLSFFGTGGFAINSNGKSGGIDVNNASVGSDISTTGNLADGTWSHIAVTNDAGVTSLYVNGIFQASTEQEMAIGANLKIGGVFGESWYGQVDEVGVWSRVLSTVEITSLYNNGIGKTYPFNQKPYSPLFYNNAQNDGDWGNILNWWQDGGFTIQATALPTATNPINLYNEVTQNTQGADQCFCSSGNFWSANFGAGLTLQATGVVNMQGTSLLAGTTTDGVSMHDSSQLTSTSIIDGNVVMRDSSRAFGHILGNAEIHYDGGNGQYPIGGLVDGTLTYLGWPAISPQWFNDQVSGGADDGDFSNKANWWTNNTYTTRPVNAEGTQELPDPSTNVFIAPNKAIYANTGTANPAINSLTANTAELVNISLTVSNGATFSGSTWGMYQATLYGNATFKSGSYNQYGVIHGTATYESAAGLQGAWNTNSLSNINIAGSYGSSGFAVNISGGGGGFISRLLNLPWFIKL